MFHENWYSETQCNDLKNLLKQTLSLTEGHIIEIGCWEGRSTYNLAQTCYPQTLLCNDTWLGNIEESKATDKTNISELLAKERNVYETFIHNMNLLTQGNYTVIKKDCIEWLSTYNEPIKFIHIDASHEYESVAKTLDKVLPLMVKGGIVCGDDFIDMI